MIQLLKAFLRKMCVLTMFAPQIAAGAGKAQSKMAWDEMVERRFFNWSDINDSGFAVDKGI